MILTIKVGINDSPIHYLNTTLYPDVQAMVIETKPLQELKEGLESLTTQDADVKPLVDPMAVVKFSVSGYLGHILNEPQGVTHLHSGVTKESFENELELTESTKYLIACAILNYIIYTPEESLLLSTSAEELAIEAISNFSQTLGEVSINTLLNEADQLTH